MRRRVLGCVLVSLVAVTAEARRFTPGAAFTATLQSTTTGATVTMTWHTRRICSQFQVLGFRCRGTWECDGAACPGRRGPLAFVFDRARYDQVMLTAGRRVVCLATAEAGPEPPPQQPPFHWRYWCFAHDTATLIDSGTVLVEWMLAS